MHFKYVCVLTTLFSVTCEARIKINITEAPNKHDLVVTSIGTDTKLITGMEIQMFNFTKHNIERGFRIELGKVPDDLFLMDPTPYENLFHDFEWEQVKRKMYVKNINVLDAVHNDVVLAFHQYINNSTDTTKSNLSMYVDVDYSVYSSWSKDGIPEDDIYYDLIFNFNNNQLQYANKWRNTETRNINLAFGTSRQGYIEIKPGQVIETKLSAHKTVFLIEIEYAAVLTGSIIGDYENLYGKYHFYAPSVKDIMKAANLRNEIITTEVIEIRCYTSPKLDVYDKSGRKVNIILPKIPLLFRKKNHL